MVERITEEIKEKPGKETGSTDKDQVADLNSE